MRSDPYSPSMATLYTPATSKDTPAVTPTCPLCHTVHTALTAECLEAGAYWECATCGHTWSPRRLETVAAYEQYVATH